MQAATEETASTTETHHPESPGTEGSPGPAVPDRRASFEEKMRYYRSQHTTVGVRATHLVGIPGVAFSLPILVARPRAGLPLFAASWGLQIAGHKLFEKNKPALTKGFFTYQFCGLAFWCEEVVNLLGGRPLSSGSSSSTSS